MSTTPEPIAKKTTTTFRMDCSVSCNIAAKPERVWALLTDAAGFPSWNTTVTSIKGSMAEGQKLEIKVPSAPTRTFRPKVTRLEPNKRMEWSDGMAPMFKGVRTFSLTPGASPKETRFEMVEVFSGLMLPMIKGSLPDFGPIFETYAADLRRAAEAKR